MDAAAFLSSGTTHILYTFNVRRPENIDAFSLQPLEVTGSSLVGNLVVFTHRPCRTAP